MSGLVFVLHADEARKLALDQTGIQEKLSQRETQHIAKQLLVDVSTRIRNACEKKQLWLTFTNTVKITAFDGFSLSSHQFVSAVEDILKLMKLALIEAGYEVSHYQVQGNWSSNTLNESVVSSCNLTMHIAWLPRK